MTVYCSLAHIAGVDVQLNTLTFVDAQLGALPEEQHMCKEIGLQGECVETNGCLCLCYTVNRDSTDVEAAYFGELGYELQLYSPYIYYLHHIGRLKKTIGPSGSAAYNYFSPNHTEQISNRHNCQGTYVHRNPHHTPFDYHNWLPPPYKQHYNNNVLVFDKPLLVIHNKYTWEWAEPPANFIDIPTLLELATMLKSYYTIVYIRPVPHARGYSADESDMLEFSDHEMLKESHPEVLLFHELLKQYHEYDFNRLQMMLHANCEHFISVLGGNAVIASYFAGTNVVFAIKGHETEHATEYGELYRHLAMDPEQAVVHRVKAYPELLDYVSEHFLPRRSAV